MPQSSQLAAIMVTDIVGHDQLLSEDKVKADQLSLKSKTIQEPLIEKHNGRWLKDLEDGAWASFENTLDAVNCARELWATMKLQPNFEVSIHIHLGEVNFSDNQVVGDAITTATQIRNREGKSGIFISESIYNTIQNNQSINLTEITKPKLAPVTETITEEEPEELSMDNSLLHNLKVSVEKNMENEQFGVEDLAAEVSLSRSHLHRKLQQLTGQSISQYIRSIRLTKSMDLLEKDVATVSEIAYRVGFGSPTYFIKCFHEHYGYPPGEVKKRQSQKLNEGGSIETEFLEEKPVSQESEPIRLYNVKDTWNKLVVNRLRATILISDISGFSVLKAQDNKMAQAVLKENLEVHKELFLKHEGVFLKEIGDTIIAYFQKVDTGIQCGVELLKTINARTDYDIRVGLNFGNLVLDEDEVYGEGLNVTSRLVQGGTEGSMIITQRLIDELGDQVKLNTEFLGSYELKGVNRSVGLYAVEDHGFNVPNKLEIRERLKPSDIEGLESHHSRFFIEQIFEAMTNVRPELVLTLKDKQTDVRLLAYQIIRNYPWPVSVELRRLFSASLRETSLKRLLQLTKTIDRILKLVCFILVNEIHAKGVRLSTEFGNRFKDLRTHDLVWIIKEISSLFAARKLEYFMTEMKGIFDENFFFDMETWASEKDSLLETGPDLNDDLLEQKCKKNEEILTSLLIRTAYMINYKLVNVGSIKVHKSKNREAQFEHSIDILNSPDSEFRTREELMKNFSDSNAVLIMKDIKDPENFLNLSPLVIDTHHEKLEVKSALKRDVFLYSKFQEGKIQYAGTEVTEMVDMKQLSNYSTLLEEFEDIIEKLSINASQKT